MKNSVVLFNINRDLQYSVDKDQFCFSFFFQRFVWL